jgi:hypothetical protein
MRVSEQIVSEALCPDCRDELIAVARAGLSILADHRAKSAELMVAADVVTEAVADLRLPSENEE